MNNIDNFAVMVKVSNINEQKVSILVVFDMKR